MQDSGGRRVKKNIILDLNTIKFCTPDMLDTFRKEIPLLADYQPDKDTVPTNLSGVQGVYRTLFM